MVVVFNPLPSDSTKKKEKKPLPSALCSLAAARNPTFPISSIDSKHEFRFVNIIPATTPHPQNLLDDDDDITNPHSPSCSHQQDQNQ